MPDQTQAEPASPTRADPKLLELLVCPLTRTLLEYDAAGRSWSRAPPSSPIRSATASRSCCRRRRARWSEREPER